MDKRLFKPIKKDPLEPTSDEELVQILLDAKGANVFVQWTATWCQPCKVIRPYFDAQCEKHPEAVFVRADIEKCEMTAAKANVTSVPTFQVFFEGRLLAQHQGASSTQLEEFVSKILAVNQENSKPGHQSEPGDDTAQAAIGLLMVSYAASQVLPPMPIVSEAVAKSNVLGVSNLTLAGAGILLSGFLLSSRLGSHGDENNAKQSPQPSTLPSVARWASTFLGAATFTNSWYFVGCLPLVPIAALALSGLRSTDSGPSSEDGGHGHQCGGGHSHS